MRCSLCAVQELRTEPRRCYGEPRQGRKVGIYKWVSIGPQSRETIAEEDWESVHKEVALKLDLDNFIRQKWRSESFSTKGTKE